MMYTMTTGRRVRIPDETIQKCMTNLNISQEEAIQMYLEDEGYLENAQVAELTEKAKDVKGARGTGERKPREKRERKENTEKRNIVMNLYEFVKDSIGKAEIVNPEREITFNIGENHYSLTLICHRNKDKS